MPEIIFSRYKTDFLDLYFLHDGSFVKMNALDGSLRTMKLSLSLPLLLPLS
jgi:hypothetical protein